MGDFLRRVLEQEGRESILRQEPELDFGNVRSGVLAQALAAGDAVVSEALAEMCWYLGLGIANLVTLLGPKKIVLGGGVMEALGGELLGTIRESMAQHVFPAASADDVELELSALGDDAVALGALAYCRESFRSG